MGQHENQPSNLLHYNYFFLVTLIIKFLIKDYKWTGAVL